MLFMRRSWRVGVVCALASGVVVSATGTAGAQQVTGPSSIEISQTRTSPDVPSGFCLPAFLAMRHTTFEDSSIFRLNVIVSAPLCDPIDPVAAVYAMPLEGGAWPQTLVETKGFRVQEPGTTQITFTKRCAPVQFDVINGPTPPTVAPWGPYHGPLLFPFDTNSARQHVGCGPAPVIPEVPTALILPISTAVLLGGAAALVTVRRRRSLA